MNQINIFLLILTLLSLLAAVITVCFCAYKQRMLLNSLDKMLEAAISGSFEEDCYNESLLSLIEIKFAQYLKASSLTLKKSEHDRAYIKELISDISHQTKTPIANLLLYTQLLTEQSLTPKVNTCVSAIEQQSQKLCFLIDSLITTSRLETEVFTLHPQKQEIMPMLLALKEEIAPKASSKGITLTLLPTKEQACFDLKWTSEAILNIVDNAVKYSLEGGQIKIQVIAYELFCRIDVEDQGIGIASEEQANIFQRFYRSQSVSTIEGVGIGLYLSRQIIAKEGGFIKVSSKLKKGSLFSVFLLRS